MGVNLRNSLNNGLNTGLRQSISGGVDNLGFFKTASLDLQFASNKTLNDRVSGSNLITFTRASTGTYVGSDGLIKTATNNTPRFDHDPDTGTSLGLLIEEARTNYCKDGTGFTVTSGNGRTQPSNGTFSSTTVANPTGATSTVLFTTNAVSGTSIQISGGDTTLGNTGNSMSMFIKPNGITKIFLTTYATAGNQGAYFELTGNGSVAGVQNNLSTDQYFIDPYPNGWYRLGVKNSARVIYALKVWEYDAENSPQFTSVTGDGTSGFYIWGWQNELGADFWSSVIPTSGTAVTRAADVAQITGTNFSDFYNQTEGTTVSSARTFTPTGTDAFIYGYSGAGSSERMEHNAKTSNQFLIYDTSGVEYSKNIANYTQNQTSAAAFAYKLNSANSSLDGTLGTEDTSVNLVTPNEINIGARFNSTLPLNGHIKRLSYFSTRLPDATLESITSES